MTRRIVQSDLYVNPSDNAAFTLQVTSQQTGRSADPITLLQASSLDELNWPLRNLMTFQPSEEADPGVLDTPLIDMVHNPADANALRQTLTQAGLVSADDQFRMNTGQFGYYVNMDERGEFHADVRDHADTSVFEIQSAEEMEALVEAVGAMKHKDDLKGLENHLQEVGMLSDTDSLYDSARFERFQDLEMQEAAEIADLARYRHILWQQRDYTVNSGAEVKVDRAMPTVSIATGDNDDQQVFLQGHEADEFIEQADTHFDEAQMPMQDAYEVVASPWVDAIAPADEPSPSPQ